MDIHGRVCYVLKIFVVNLLKVQLAFSIRETGKCDVIFSFM